MLTEYLKIEKEILLKTLENISNVRVGLLGDICLDVYWEADMRRSELSRETPHYPLPIVRERMSPGAGGNVAVNLAALKPKSIVAVSVAGDDWRAAELLRLMDLLNIDVRYVHRSRDLITNAYCKPLRAGISEVVYEDPRLDFCNYHTMNKHDEDTIIDALDNAAGDIDILCVADQFCYGVITERVRQRVIELAKKGLPVVADSRSRIAFYKNMILKPNELEGVTATGGKYHSGLSLMEYAQTAKALAIQNDAETVMTLGANGAIYANKEKAIHIPAREINDPIDICGAGDAFLSGFAASTAAGADRTQAVYIAGLCSEISIRQIGTTGSASHEQILELYDSI